MCDSLVLSVMTPHDRANVTTYFHHGVKCLDFGTYTAYSTAFIWHYTSFHHLSGTLCYQSTL